MRVGVLRRIEQRPEGFEGLLALRGVQADDAVGLHLVHREQLVPGGGVAQQDRMGVAGRKWRLRPEGRLPEARVTSLIGEIEDVEGPAPLDAGPEFGGETAGRPDRIGEVGRAAPGRDLRGIEAQAQARFRGEDEVGMEEEGPLGDERVLPDVRDPLGAAGQDGAEVADDAHLVLERDVLIGEEQQVAPGERFSELLLLRRVEGIAEIELDDGAERRGQLPHLH